jgi:hypothetical protein
MKAMQQKIGCQSKGNKDIRTNHKEKNASQERTIAEMDAMLAEMRAWLKETMAYQEAMGACPESREPTSVQIESELEHEEVTKEEAMVKIITALKKWHGDRHLAIRYHGQLKKRTQGNGGSWQKLAAACRGLTCCSIPAWHKGHCCQGQGKDKAIPRTQKGWMDEKR